MIKSGQEKKQNEVVVEVKSASSEGEDEDKFNGIWALFPGVKKFIDVLKQIAKEVKEKAEEEEKSKAE